MTLIGRPPQRSRGRATAASEVYQRKIDGVVNIKALGKCGIAGKVTFETNDLMWAFIKAHTGVKFAHNGNERAIWYSIEKTTEERQGAAKMSAIIRGLVRHLVEVSGKDETTARRIIDADYKKGIVVFEELPRALINI